MAVSQWVKRMWPVWVLIPVSLVLVVFFGFLSYGSATQDGSQTVFVEAYRYSLQLLVVVVLGGLVKYGYDQREKRRVELSELNEFRKSVLQDLVHVRTNIERLKRVFLITESRQQALCYKRTVRRLVHLRIRLSRIWHNFETSKTSFSQPKEIQERLECMKEFLDGIAREYDADAVAKLLEAESPNAPFLNDRCIAFSDYVGWKKGELYRSFLAHYREALSLVRHDILNRASSQAVKPADPPSVRNVDWPLEKGQQGTTELDRELQQAQSEGSRPNVVIDLSSTTLDSAGAHALVEAHMLVAKAGGRLRLVGVDPLHFLPYLELFRNRDEALASLGIPEADARRRATIRPKRMRRALQIAGLMLFGFGLGLGGLEAALRLIGVGDPAELDPSYDRPVLPYSPDPARRNPWGRNEEDVMRVAVIGDSFTNAFANQWYDGYGQRLEHLLNLRDGARPVEVRVFARNGTTTWRQLPLLDRALNQGADLVILGIFLNDTQVPRDPKIEARSVRIPKGWRLELLRSSRALGWIYLRSENLRRKLTFNEHQEYLYSSDNEGFQLFEGAVRKFAEKTSRSGAGLVAVIWPNMAALGPDYPLQLAHERIGWVLGEAGVPYLDLLDEFRGKSHDRMAAYPGVDSHPSEIAHRVGATAIFSYLVSEGHVDGAYGPRKQQRMGENYWLGRLNRERNRFGQHRRN